MYMERYSQRPRHIEIQVVADTHGNYAHLGERECSVQRRHQKLIEEAPSPALRPEPAPPGRRRRCALIEAIGYTNVGTLEFLLDEDGSFYFMEMNTRIQVEHPVTELVTGLDLVREQILIASGEPLSFDGEARRCGHAIELPHQRRGSRHVRALARQDHRAALPGGNGVRVDTHMYEGYVVPPTTTRCWPS
jgi:acetyl-CoA carboxylase biotin carboxylase subunit